MNPDTPDAPNYTGYAACQFDERTGLYQWVMMETPTLPQPPRDPTDWRVDDSPHEDA